MTKPLSLRETAAVWFGKIGNNITRKSSSWSFSSSQPISGGVYEKSV